MPLDIKLPCSLDLNVYKAYCDTKTTLFNCHNKRLNALDLKWNEHHPKRLRSMVLDKIIEHWETNPIFNELPRQEDRNYILSNLDVNLPIEILSAHIKEDVFWRRCYLNKFHDIYPNVGTRNWINIFMEKHLQEFLENMETCDYDPEAVQTIMDICSPYITQLEIRFLQPSMSDFNDHIPFDFILFNLPDLRRFRLTYSTKTVQTNFYLGCSVPSKNDILNLCRGLKKCYELLEFILHTVRLESYMLEHISRVLDKGCSNLVTLSMEHCSIGNAGLQSFLHSCNKDSFQNLQNLNLTNCYLSSSGACILSRALRGKNIKNLILKLNPIESDGAAAIFSVLPSTNIIRLNISGCSITASILKLLLRLIIENTHLIDLDISNNNLGMEIGKNIFRVIGFNKTLKAFDLRNTLIPTDIRFKISEMILKNKNS